MAANPTTVAQKWASRMAGSGEAMKAGVAAVTTAPTELAAQAKDRYLAGVMRAAEEGKFEEGLRAVSLSDWQRAMTNKGVPNMQTGAREGVTKVEKFMRDFLPFAEQVSQEIAAMPKGSLEDSIARARAAITKMASYRRRR